MVKRILVIRRESAEDRHLVQPPRERPIACEVLFCGTGGVLVRAHDGALQKHLFKIRILGQFGEHFLPDAIIEPSCKALVHAVRHGCILRGGNHLRLNVWPYALDRVRERPWLAMGYGRGIARKPLQDRFAVREIWHAHNLVLETAIQVGIPGAVLLLVLIGVTAVHGLRQYASRNAIRAACGIAILCIVTGMLLRNMTDVLWVRQNSLLYWGMLGMLFGIGRAHADSGDPGARGAP